MPKRILLFMIAFLIYAADACALSFSQSSDLVSLTLIPEKKTLSPETKTLSFIAKAEIKPDWHLYWDNPGDTGDPTTLSFYDSPYYQETSSIHSTPAKSVFENIITSYIYQKEFYFKISFALKDIKNIERLPFSAVLSYTACSQSCLPGTINISLALPVKETPQNNPSYASALIEAEKTFPEPLAAIASLNDELLELKIKEEILKSCKEPEFVSRYPKKSVLSNLPETSVSAKGSLNVNFNKDELPPDFKGILLCPGHAYYIEPEPVTVPLTKKAEKQDSPSPASNTDPLFYYLITAFIAGLILNLMPCVLPVLGLKALYLVKHKEKASPLSALAYIAGVITSFLLLSAIIFALKETGTELGWGFQLQSPAFNAVLLILFFLIFLNLIDKLPISNSFADKLSRFAANNSFITGFFAVIIACPCTGPFMGAAVGYAIAKPAAVYFAVFLSLSLGYALPYALIESFPRIFLKFIPKPGHWMLTLKHILAIPMALTCLWLGWVIFNQLSFFAPKKEIAWQPYSKQTLEYALEQDRPVFINFTAKWCLICLLNDKTTLSSQTFKNLVEKNNITLIKADWTNRSETIKTALNSYNRNSIPLYIYYKPGTKTPQILPQILTNDIIKEIIN